MPSVRSRLLTGRLETKSLNDIIVLWNREQITRAQVIEYIALWNATSGRFTEAYLLGDNIGTRTKG